MSRRRFTSALLVGLLASGSAYAAPLSPDGPWYDKDRTAVIRMHRCGDPSSPYCGTISWMREPNDADGRPKLDARNVDESLRSRPMVGADIFTGLVAQEDGWKGRVYNPENGKSYDVTFTVRPERDAADIRGCLMSYLCKTVTFTRAPDDAAKPVAHVVKKASKVAVKATVPAPK